MLHDNISSTHEKYEWNTWTIFLLTWNILHVYLVFIMSHDLYHVTWHVSLTWSMSCDIILIIMSMQKNLLGIFKIMSTWFFQNPRRIIMSTWKIYHVQQRRIFLMICSRIKKKEKAESKNCHAKTMLSLKKPINLIWKTPHMCLLGRSSRSKYERRS